ncbi:MAG: hypothetical protein PHF57_12625 [Methanoregula sp.]|jgi:hypothetical protein|nr:hypothetical protein [Methanoregula sp.]
MRENTDTTKNREMNISRITTIGLLVTPHSGTGYGYGIRSSRKTGEKKIEQASGAGNLGSGIPEGFSSHGDVI